MVSFEKSYNRSKSITGYYAIPTNYTSIGVTVGRGHEALLTGNQ